MNVKNKILILDLDFTLGSDNPAKILENNKELVAKNPYGPKVWALFEDSARDMALEPLFLPFSHYTQIKDAFKEVVVITSRLEKWRKPTEAWLSRWGFDVDHVYMRPNSKKSIPGEVFKRGVLESHVLNKYKAKNCIAIDDEIKICTMYRSFGVLTYQSPQDWVTFLNSLKLKRPKLKKEHVGSLEKQIRIAKEDGTTLRELSEELGCTYKYLLYIRTKLSKRLKTKRSKNAIHRKAT